MSSLPTGIGLRAYVLRNIKCCCNYEDLRVQVIGAVAIWSRALSLLRSEHYGDDN